MSPPRATRTSLSRETPQATLLLRYVATSHHLTILRGSCPTMDRIARALKNYAARRFPSYNSPPPPLRRRAAAVSDSAAVMRDLYVVMNDLKIATRRAMKRHDYEPEQVELFSEP